MKTFNEINQQLRRNRYNQQKQLGFEQVVESLDIQKINRIHSKPEVDSLPLINQTKSKFKFTRDSGIIQNGENFKEEIVGQKLIQNQNSISQQIEKFRMNPIDSQEYKKEIQKILQSASQPGHLVFHPIKLDPRLKSQQVKRKQKFTSIGFDPFRTQNQFNKMKLSNEEQNLGTFTIKRKKLTKSAVKYLNDKSEDNSLLNVKHQAQQIIYGQKFEMNQNLNQYSGFENDDDDIPLDMIFQEKKKFFIKENDEEEDQQ